MGKRLHQDTANSSTLAEVARAPLGFPSPHKLQFFVLTTTVSCGDLSRPFLYIGGMTNEDTQYHITIKGHLDASWQDWFDGLTITLTDDDNTILSGDIIDQAALHGVFKKIRNLGLTIISVNPQTKGE